jgi:hypothetical protein
MNNLFIDPIDYWAQQVTAGSQILEQVPKNLRLRVARRLGRSLPAGDPPDAAQESLSTGAEERPGGREALRGTFGLILALALPFFALVVLFWVLGRSRSGAGGAGFVEGLGKVKMPAGAGGAGFVEGAGAG